jgi:hypothetical protein
MSKGIVAKAELVAAHTVAQPHDDAHRFGTFGISYNSVQQEAPVPCSFPSPLATLSKFVAYFGDGEDKPGKCSCNKNLSDLNVAGKHLLAALKGCYRALPCAPKTNGEAAKLVRIQEALAKKQLERATEEVRVLKEKLNAFALELTQRIAELPGCTGGNRGVALCFAARNLPLESITLTWGDIIKNKPLHLQIRLMEVCSCAL